MNQHRRCKGPTLVLFKDDAPDAPSKFAPMPADCVRPGGVVWLRVAYGTLIPLSTTRKRAAASQMARQVVDQAEWRAAKQPTISHVGGALSYQPFASLYQPPYPLATFAPLPASSTLGVAWSGESVSAGASTSRSSPHGSAPCSTSGENDVTSGHESEAEAMLGNALAGGGEEAFGASAEAGGVVGLDWRPPIEWPARQLPVIGCLPRTCASCRSAKVRCDLQDPCSRCRRLGLECTVATEHRRGRPTDKDRQIQAAVQLVCMHS